MVIKLLFDGVLFTPAFVGEATSLPRGTTLQNWVRSGEFVQITNISPFNQPLKKRSVAGICSLPYSWLVNHLPA